MKSSLLLIFLFLHLSLFQLKAQDDKVAPTDFDGSFSDRLLNEAGDEIKSRDLYERLLYLSENPLNINECSEEDLEELVFLSDFHIFSLLDYRKKYGELYSLEELALIPGFDREIIENLRPFLYAGGTIQQQKPPFLRSDLLFRTCLNDPLRKGFHSSADSTERFLGNRYKELLKYQLKYGRKIRAGFSIEKDEGEELRPFRKRSASGFSSAYLMLGLSGTLHKILLGDFRLSSGNGLIFGYGRNLKSAEVIHSHRLPSLHKYSSSAENGFFRGAAFELRKEKFYCISFLSGRRRDAVIEERPEEGPVILSLAGSGLSRNQKELQHTKNVKERSLGILGGFHSDNFSAGYNLQYIRYDKPLSYRILPDRYSKRKEEQFFLLQGLHYSFRSDKLLFFGELAVRDREKIAAIQTLSCRINSLFTASLIYRSYHPSCLAFHNSPFGEGSTGRNERGFYAGLEFFPSRKMKTSAYIDIYTFPWLKYNTSAPSGGWDLLISNSIILEENFKVLLFVKREEGFCENSGKGLEGTGMLKQMVPEKNLRIMVRAGWEREDYYAFKTRCELKKYGQKGKWISTGSLLSQDMNATLIPGRLKAYARYAVFSTPSWDVRIYAWEQDLLYSFASPLFYGRGSRYYFMVKWQMWKSLTLWFKYAATRYTGLHESGSGADYRKGDVFREYRLQFQWKIPNRF